MPESQFIVEITDTYVICHRPDGQTETVRWDDLQKVDILTNSDGPLLPDCFWVLQGVPGGCVIPQGATGDAELLHRLQALPDFDNMALINAMGSTQDGLHSVWSKSGALPAANTEPPEDLPPAPINH